ncbi:VanW family protein [Bacillus sp. V59.32b]|uniref:VanW family protein n=1 Tax=Bacillus sp. V59.32b TaxID=1758642 RepID=UPI000E3C4E6A|nr:VanW family protein [Bacillus sp. V59.32b]RFU60516.1 vanomycin resistance protein VanB [Bacillus sp. V59.32b]
MNNLKKGMLLFGLVAVISGFVLSGEAVGSSEKEHQGISDHDKKEMTLLKKEWIDPELVLIDSRNGAELQKLKASAIRNTENAEETASQLEVKFDRPMIPAKLRSNGQLNPGQSRVVIDKKVLMKEFENFKAFQREIKVPISETAPNVKAGTIANIDQALLGSFVTKFNPSVTGRSSNIALSAQEINQIILGPGDRFYFNRIVGERTVQRGYQKAMEIVNKEFVEGIGGGICQTSSTLYNAIDRAGLKIIELHHHSKEVGYVAKDRDATVSFGGKDFKFMNNKDYPVLIKTNTNRQNGTLEVQVRAAAQYVAKN